MMHKQLQRALDLQRNAWEAGHFNYGASIDVYSEALDVLNGFKHLNPAQIAFKDTLTAMDELKYAKHLGAAARKAVRHFIVTLK